MDGVSYFFWLASQAVEVTIYFFPAALLILAGGIGAAASCQVVPRDQWRLVLSGVVIQLAVPVAILLCGVLFVHNTGLDEAAPQWPEWLVAGLLLFHLPLAATLIVLLRGGRWFILAVAIAIFGYSVGAAFMSTMSVSGRWL